jgi:hypothetical protein
VTAALIAAGIILGLATLGILFLAMIRKLGDQ